MATEGKETGARVGLPAWIAVTWLLTAALTGPALEAHAADRHAAVFQETKFDFGSSVQGTLIEHDFVVTNQGATPLRIGKVNLTPPLLATRIPGEIAPGTSAAIHTQLDTSQLQGSFSGELVPGGPGSRPGKHRRGRRSHPWFPRYRSVPVAPPTVAP